MGIRRDTHDDDAFFCNAKKHRSEERCSQRAGWGTNHPGIGRCKLHGGSVRVKHGLYSKVVHEQLREKIALAEATTPIDQMIEALNLQTALAMEYVSRFEPGVPLTGKDISLLSELLEKISRIAERIFKARALEAITVSEGLAILEGFARLAEKYIDDPAKLKGFGQDAAKYVGGVAQGKMEQPRTIALPAGAYRATNDTG